MIEFLRRRLFFEVEMRKGLAVSGQQRSASEHATGYLNLTKTFKIDIVVDGHIEQIGAYFGFCFPSDAVSIDEKHGN